MSSTKEFSLLKRIEQIHIIPDHFSIRTPIVDIKNHFGWRLGQENQQRTQSLREISVLLVAREAYTYYLEEPHWMSLARASFSPLIDLEINPEHTQAQAHHRYEYARPQVLHHFSHVGNTEIPELTRQVGGWISNQILYNALKLGASATNQGNESSHLKAAYKWVAQVMNQTENRIGTITSTNSTRAVLENIFKQPVTSKNP